MSKPINLVTKVFSRNPRERELLAGKSLVFIGVGSVGSAIAVMAARAGVGRFILIDPDVLAAENVGRHICSLADVGKPKVEAVADLIHHINPKARVEKMAQDFREMETQELQPYLDQSALLVASTDSFECQSRVNSLSLETGTPAVFVGCWGEASTGEILYMDPGLTPCYECYAAFRRNSEVLPINDPRKYTDISFDQSKVPGQAGLWPNILIICGFAFHIIFAMLSGKTGASAKILDPANSLFLVNVADYDSPLPFWSVTPASVRHGCGVCDPARLLEEAS